MTYQTLIVERRGTNGAIGWLDLQSVGGISASSQSGLRDAVIIHFCCELILPPAKFMPCASLPR